MNWAALEQRVKQFARLIYNRDAGSINLQGMQFDCFLEIEPDQHVCIEVTQNHTLEKVRNDINKLILLRSNMASQGVFVKCILILEKQPSDLMKETASASRIELLTIDEFERKFIDYKNYTFLRNQKNIGSAIDPWTGKVDNNPYVPVKYVESKSGKEYKIDDIKYFLDRGNKIILTGSFGSGKSRCIREIFDLYKSEKDPAYCFVINLRENWSLKRSNEIVRRHFEDLGFEPNTVNNSIKLLNLKSSVFMLDGFDEIGSQNWSNEPNKLSKAKQDALVGVRDLITNFEGGLLITGRENYFNNDKEMFSFLGLKESSTIYLKCKDEFNKDEMHAYMNNIGCANLMLPPWAPRKPLIFQMIATISERVAILSQDNEYEFWDKLIDFICQREANINKAILDPTIIKQVLIELANLTRTKNNDYGPISNSEVSQIFSQITGRSVTDESAIILSRLPSFGRVGSDSSDYQFIDMYMLDGLRAEYMHSHYDSDEAIKTTKWINPLREFGQRLLFFKINVTDPLKIVSKISYWSRSNIQAAADLLCAFLIEGDTEEIVDFRGTMISNCFIEKLNLSNLSLGHLYLESCIIESVDISDCFIEPKESLRISGCEINTVTGISDASALPPYFENCTVSQFSSINTTSKIKSLGFGVHQIALLSCIRRVYQQYGRGRKERSLIKGFKNQQEKKAIYSIVDLMMKHEVIERINGNEGYIYKPVNSSRHRMTLIMKEMNTSKDELWTSVTKLDAK
ncbi:NACHT domain-containing protein [Cronobacter dublinensis]